MKNVIAAACIVVLLSGCVSTIVTSYTDPAYASERFENVVIFANLEDLSYRQKLEHSFVKYAANYGIDLTPSLDVYPPTREMDVDAFLATLENNHFDAFIMIDDAQSNTETVYGTYGGTLMSGTLKNTDIDVALISVSNNDTVWTGNADTSGNSDSSWNQMANSFADGVLKKLSETSLIATVPGYETPAPKNSRYKQPSQQSN